MSTNHFERSAELDQLAAALADAQGEFEAVGKTETNPFFKSKYAGLPSIVKAATPTLVKHGLSVAQLPGHDEHGHTLTTMLLHKSGQFIAATMRLNPGKDDPQGLGSALTYGRRYSYMAALGLVADEDDDGNAASKPAAPAVEMIRPKQYTALVAAYKDAGAPIAMVAEFLGCEEAAAAVTDGIGALTAEKADRLLDKLTSEVMQAAA